MSHYSKLLIFFFIFITSYASSWSFSLFNTTQQCSGPQKNALLLFKQSLFSINVTSSNWRCHDWLGSGYYPIMMNWNNDTDCCNWDGVSCNPFTGDVIGLDLSCGMLQGTVYLNTTLFLLPHLQRLNLAYNSFFGSQLPREIGKFSNSLTHLNLSRTYFGGEIPSEIFLLSKLVSVDLSFSYFNFQYPPHFLSNLFQNFTLLEDLWLNSCGLDGYLPTHLNTSSLMTLDLGINFLKGRLSVNIFDLHHLEILDLSNNYDVTGPFPKVNKSISLPLKWLDIRFVNLSGETIPDSIGHFKSLTYLSLSACGLVGSIPKSLVNLSNLATLDLSYNMLNRTLPSSLFTLPSIEYVHLSHNMFSGFIPSDFFNCRSLKRLSLSNNRFEGKINQASSSLSFIELINLTDLDISHNNFTGLLELDTLLSNLPKLISLDLSYSGLSVITSKATDYVNPDFSYLNLASCNLTMFPESIQAMKKLQKLDLSNNKIRGHISDWAGKIGELRYVNLSHNFITGLPLFQWNQVTNLYLQSNKIQGSFPLTICSMTNLNSLDMSKNRFSGVIPKCLENNTDSLYMINLRANHFNGTIPDVFSECGPLAWFILNGNQLEGEVPSSLSKCHHLEIFDLGNNQLNGTFPEWLGDLPKLQVLVLKSNNLHGAIGTSTSIKLPFQRLQVFDLSHNGFLGNLPQKYFQNFIAMKDVEKIKPYYVSSSTEYYSIIVTVKGHELEFQKLLVNYTIVDISSNRLEGEIPNVIGSLNSLIVLNLSHNKLNGQIPHALGKLSSIESLDLSWNQLTGEIPQSLADLTFLGYLNLSQNHLMGRIPQGKQFNTFEGNSFGGNQRLCGLQLQKNCTGHPHEPQVEGDGEEEESGFTWQVVMLGYGCGTLLGLVMGFLMLSTGRPKWFNEISDAVEYVIFLKRRNKRRYIFIGK